MVETRCMDILGSAWIEGGGSTGVMMTGRL
jgi:hypothetical protein